MGAFRELAREISEQIGKYPAWPTANDRHTRTYRGSTLSKPSSVLKTTSPTFEAAGSSMGLNRPKASFSATSRKFLSTAGPSRILSMSHQILRFEVSSHFQVPDTVWEFWVVSGLVRRWPPSSWRTSLRLVRPSSFQSALPAGFRKPAGWVTSFCANGRSGMRASLIITCRQASTPTPRRSLRNAWPTSLLAGVSPTARAAHGRSTRPTERRPKKLATTNKKVSYVSRWRLQPSFRLRPADLCRCRAPSS